MTENATSAIAAAKAFIAEHGAYKYGPPIQALMDAVSGVTGYRLASTTDQGFIHKKLMHSRMEHNHIVDIDTMISKFWYGAIQAVLRAQPEGTVVNIKNLTGEAPRPTQMNPLAYIRNMGIAAARKYIDECCRQRLKVLCHDCNIITNLGKQREIDIGCKCGCKESTSPQAFVTNRYRVCVKCGVKRLAIFERICGRSVIDTDTGAAKITGGCGSNNVTIIQTEEFVDSNGRDAWEWKFGLTETDPESDASTAQLTQDAANFAKACIEALPKDLSDPQGDSKTRKILRILVDPTEGAAICKQCREQDPETCGAQTFDLSECVNYSKKLGQHFGYSTTLANRRVKKVRSHTLQFAIEHQDQFATAKYIAKKLCTT